MPVLKTAKLRLLRVSIGLEDFEHLRADLMFPGPQRAHVHRFLGEGPKHLDKVGSGEVVSNCCMSQMPPNRQQSRRHLPALRDQSRLRR